MSKTASSTKKGTAAKPAKPSTHPSWIDMIKECIIANPGDSRLGVSRPTIKKFIESKYRIRMDAFHTSQLSRAIVSGSEKGSFVLPKGPAGKVKLAPKAKADAAKEFTKAEKENKKATKPEPAVERKPSTTKKRTLAASMNENKKPASAKGTKAQVSKKSAKGELKTLPRTSKARPARKPAAAKAKPTVKKTTTKRSAAKKETAAKTAASAAKARGRVTPRTAASGKKSAPTTKSTKSTKPSSATAKSTSKA